MKLKIKHLSYYLPSIIQLFLPKYGRIITMRSCYCDGNGNLHIIDYNEGDYDLSRQDLKLILHPISDLTKEIEDLHKSLDKDNESLSYDEYKVKAGDNAHDIIPLDPDTLEDNWVLVMEKNEDTDASLEYVMK